MVEVDAEMMDRDVGVELGQTGRALGQEGARRGIDSRRGRAQECVHRSDEEGGGVEQER